MHQTQTNSPQPRWHHSPGLCSPPWGCLSHPPANNKQSHSTGLCSHGDTHLQTSTVTQYRSLIIPLGLPFTPTCKQAVTQYRSLFTAVYTHLQTITITGLWSALILTLPAHGETVSAHRSAHATHNWIQRAPWPPTRQCSLPWFSQWPVRPVRMILWSWFVLTQMISSHRLYLKWWWPVLHFQHLDPKEFSTYGGNGW